MAFLFLFFLFFYLTVWDLILWGVKAKTDDVSLDEVWVLGHHVWLPSQGGFRIQADPLNVWNDPSLVSKIQQMTVTSSNQDILPQKKYFTIYYGEWGVAKARLHSIKVSFAEAF